jgi:putative transposase
MAATNAAKSSRRAAGQSKACTSSLKKERVKKRIYNPRYRQDGFDYIEVFYNRIRRHSHLGGGQFRGL